jgi:hypothetical protein
MELRINLTSGEIYTFDVPIDEPAEMIDKIKPKEIFQRPSYQVLGKLRTVTINPDAIEWIELETLESRKNPLIDKSLEIRQLSAEAFRHWTSQNKESIKAYMEQEVDQNVLLTYGKATFKSGRSMFLEVRAKLNKTQDRVSAAQKIFKMPALFVNGELTGLFIVNPFNIATWQVVPGFKKSTPFSIPGELKEVKTFAQ